MIRKITTIRRSRGKRTASTDFVARVSNPCARVENPCYAMRRMIPIVIITGCLVLIAVGFVIWRQRYETYHLAVVQDGVLYRDGNRGPREFATMVRRVKPKTIVSLVDDDEIADREKPEFKAEIEFARQQGIPIERIPVKLGGWPTGEDVR